MKIVKKHKANKTKYSLMMKVNEICEHYGLPRHEDHLESVRTVGRKPNTSSLNESQALRENIEQDWIESVKEKTLHGQF